MHFIWFVALVSATFTQQLRTLHADNDFLQTKPEFLKTCLRHLPEFNECISAAYQHIFTTWKDGIKGLARSVPIDPLFVSKFEVIEDGENITPITVNLDNITVTGLSAAVVKNVTLKDKQFDFKMTYFVPKLTLGGHYTAMGQILLLKLDAAGDMFMEIVGGLYMLTAKMKLRSHDKFNFFDLKSIQFNAKTIKDLHFHFENLFNNKVLSDNTNAVFNENWRTFFEIFKPKIESEISKVYLAHFRSVFTQVPANFFIGDLDTEMSGLL